MQRALRQPMAPLMGYVGAKQESMLSWIHRVFIGLYPPFLAFPGFFASTGIPIIRWTRPGTEEEIVVNEKLNIGGLAVEFSFYRIYRTSDLVTSTSATP